IDVPALVEAVRALGAGRAERVDLIGASLGGSLVYAALVLSPDLPVGGVVAIGAPLRWESPHLLLRAAFRSRRLAGAIPMTGTDAVARRLFPWIARVPGALSIYMNQAHVDPKDAAQL